MTSDRALGEPVRGWTPPVQPCPRGLDGQYVRLEQASAGAHGAALWAAYAGHDGLWDYMPVGPFCSESTFCAWLSEVETATDPMFYAISDKTAGAADPWAGLASYLRIKPAAGSIELGWISLAPALQRTRAATEAWHLMMRWAFEAGYRRFEWKCNALNAPSRRAAQRLGFSYEGVFRQATVVKGRNRDTAWFAVIDKDWPALCAAHQAWLSPQNFEESGAQRRALSDLTAPLIYAEDPALGQS